MIGRTVVMLVFWLLWISGALISAPEIHAVTINYRSIGTNANVLFTAGTASVAKGQTSVTFTGGGALALQVGRGDEIVIDDEELYVLNRDSDDRLTLQAPAQKEHAAALFAIRRAYTTIQSWVHDRNGDLVAEDRREIGVCYNDGPFIARNRWTLARIHGSITDEEHFMWLMAAEGARHKGLAGRGVVLNGNKRTRYGILVEDDYTRIEGLELTGFDRHFIAAAVAVHRAREVVLDGLMIHGFDARHFESYGVKGAAHSDLILRNSIIYAGGASAVATRSKSASIQVENCTIYGMQGHGVDGKQGRISAVNTIAMGNRRGDFFHLRGGQAHNISSDGTAQGEGSMAFLHPLDQFVSIDRGAEDFHLKDTSAAIDAGRRLGSSDPDQAGRTPQDIDGCERAGESPWDIGADEVQTVPEGVWFVDPARNGDGSSWKSAFATLAQALAAAPDGEEIWVKEGTYHLSGQLVVTRPVNIYGGFAGNERRRDQRDWRKRPTLLDAPGSGRCLVLAADGITVSGFEFSFGNATDGGAVMAGPASRFLISDCRFEGNQAGNGGGLYVKNAAGIVRNCIFTGNSASRSGGAIYAESSGLNIVNCIFLDNSAGASGVTSTGGGAVFTRGSGAIIANSSFSGNSTHFLHNRGGAVYNFAASTAMINCILWGNAAQDGPQVSNFLSTQASVTHCDIDQAGFETGNGNMRRDPLWADPAGEDFRLSAGSPCIDAGTLEVAGLPETDYESAPRISGGSIDMGACEFN